MLKLIVDGNWLYCALIAASQLVGACFRIHHEVSVFFLGICRVPLQLWLKQDFMGASVQ